jgi:DNA-binding NtrC family response regulator
LSFKLLCVGDVQRNVSDRLQGEISFTCADGAFDALALLRSEPFDAIVVGMPIPGCSTLETMLDEIHRVCRTTRVIVFDPAMEMERAICLARRGAFDIVDEERLNRVLTRWVALLAMQAVDESPDEPWRTLLIGQSPRMQTVVETIRLIANRRCTILVTGETGTGKEMVARAIHQAGNRSRFPLVSINCSALPEALLEAELFGHVKGAFTGAVANRIGRFEQANRGTLFLDEIGDMPPTLQAKLLRVLQEKEFQRLGSSETVRVDVRVVAATNVDLIERMRQGRFREDLYYRLNVVPINLPSLRERPEDIPILALHFIEKICREESLGVKNATADLLNRLSRHDWPGNVRQLENAIEMAVVLSGERLDLSPGDFPLPSRVMPRAPNPGVQPFLSVPDQGLDFEETVGNIERNLLEQALTKTNGNKKAAAEMLRLKRTTLSAKLKTLSAVAAFAV